MQIFNISFKQKGNKKAKKANIKTIMITGDHISTAYAIGKQLGIVERKEEAISGNELDLLEKDVYRFCFIVDFPMYELSDEGTIDFNHNPFSMPQGGLEALETKDPLDIYAYQYDAVCNGYEILSGAVRNHDQEIMVKAFEIAGYTVEGVQNLITTTSSATGNNE